jgi:RNA polymerase sigma-70 factor (ECF subfamily)
MANESMASESDAANRDDAHLVKRAQEGDLDAFGQVALQHERSLFAHLYRMTRNADIAEDLAQEALLKAYRKLGSYRPTMPFRHWLLRIATHLAIDEFRRQARERKALESEAVSWIEASRQSERGESPDREAVSDALAQMSPADAAVLNLRYGEELAVIDIAGIVGKSAGAVKVMLHRARARLKQLLASKGQDRES